MIGLDPEVVESAASSLANESANLNALIGRVESLVAQAGRSWRGSDAQSFVQAWQGCQRGQMKSAASVLSAMSSELKQNASQQRAASAATGGGATGGSSGGGTSSKSMPLSRSGFQMDPSWSQNRRSYQDFVDYTKFMDASYGNKVDLPEGWKSVQVIDEPVSGFRMEVFVGPDNRMIVAFAGTDAKSPGDLLTDLDGNFRPTAQDLDAIMYARWLQSNNPDYQITFVGHSLGGREASVAAIATGCPAVTLDAAGVPPATQWAAAAAGGVPLLNIPAYLDDQKYNTTAFGVEGETLGQADDIIGVADRWGTEYVFPDPPGEDSGLLTNHNISTAVKAADGYYNAPDAPDRPSPLGGQDISYTDTRGTPMNPYVA